MKINVPFEKNIIPEKYGKQANSKDIKLGNPVRSFPFSIEDFPQNTQTFALTLIDYDAVPVCAFPWTHWLMANIPAGMNEIPENFSVDSLPPIIQGKNSFSSPLLENDFSIIETQFVGPTPPDKDHIYTLTVYALSTRLDLVQGYHLNEFLRASKHLVLATAQLELIGKVSVESID